MNGKMLKTGIYILAILSKLKNREEFEGGLHEKRKGKGGIRRKKKREKEKRKKGKR